jgi:hypothetical protein
VLLLLLLLPLPPPPPLLLLLLLPPPPPPLLLRQHMPSAAALRCTSAAALQAQSGCRGAPAHAISLHAREVEGLGGVAASSSGQRHRFGQRGTLCAK